MTAVFESTVVALEADALRLREDVQRRVQGGQLVRLDGKGPCTAGRWGNNFGMTKTHPADPAMCSRDRDRTLPPVLRLPVPCEELDKLFWPDVYESAKAALRRALAGYPRIEAHKERWEARAAWTRRVMELVSIALEATNIQPIFLFPSKWATEHPYKNAGDDGFLINWGLSSSGWTFDGRREGWSPNKVTDRLLGGCVPKELHEYLYEAEYRKFAATQRLNMPREVQQIIAGSITGAEAMWRRYGIKHSVSAMNAGVHWSKETLGYTALTPLPAMLAGSLLADNSQTLQALRGNHDPWTSTGFPEQDPEELWPALLPVPIPVDILIAALGREKAMAPDLGAILGFELAWRGQALAPFMTALFRNSPGPAAYVRGLNHRGQLGVVPNAQWYAELAYMWAGVITSRQYADIVADSTLFWLVNHHTFMKRAYGNAIAGSSEEISRLADALRAGRAAMLAAPAQIGTMLINILSPIAGAIMGPVANLVTEGIASYFNTPELPRSLFRRVSQNASCDISTGGGEQAAFERIAEMRLRQMTPPAPTTARAGVPPVLIGVGLVALVGAVGYYLLRE